MTLVLLADTNKMVESLLAHCYSKQVGPQAMSIQAHERCRLSLSLFLCMSLHLYLYISLYLCLYLYIYLFLSLSLSLSVSLCFQNVAVLVIWDLSGQRFLGKPQEASPPTQYFAAVAWRRGHLYQQAIESVQLYIYMHAVKSRFWPSFTLFKVNILAKSKSIFWPRSFSHYKNRGFRRFFWLSYHCVCLFCSQLSGKFLKIAFFKKRVQKLGFSIFCVLSLNFENSLFLGLPKHYKNRGFS